MNAPKLATSSTPEEWAKQGRNLFQRKKYVEAKHCFERALLPERVAIADAYILRAKAQAIRTDTKVNKQNRKQMFSAAALAFEKCARSASRKIRLDFLRLAGDCYKNAEDILLAAQAYREARLFTESVLCYRDVNHFDEAIDIVKKEASSVEQSVVKNVVLLAKLFYFNEVQVLPSSSIERETKLK
jgi:tetratricopeptide (TPR) repeat protein